MNAPSPGGFAADLSPVGRGVVAAVFAVALLAAEIFAHALAPAYLELREREAGRLDVTWQISLATPSAVSVEPVLPPACKPVSKPPERSIEVGALVTRWSMDCGPGGLTGARIFVRGLEGTSIDAIVFAELESGRSFQRLLTARAPELVVPGVALSSREGALGVFSSYVRLGVEHLLTGFDHVLFVVGLFVLVRRRQLLGAITCFTLGHSVTLALATLGIVSFPTRPVEIVIAATLVVLANEMARRPGTEPSLVMRRPWLMTLAFGLLHGLGFAGALADVGLPSGEIPLALFSFNVGIEIGQIAVVLLALALATRLRRFDLASSAKLRIVPAYAIGSLAAFWCLDRAF